MTQQDPGTRPSRGTVARYAAGSLGTGGFSTLPGLVLLYYLTDTLAVPALVGGVLIALTKIWDVVVAPVVGSLSDADRQRTGSRRRFLLLGAVALPICFVLTFCVPVGLPRSAAVGWVFVALLLATTAFATFQVPYIALPAEITSDYDERTRLLTARVVVLSLAILIFGAGGPGIRDAAGGGARGYLVMALATGALLAIGLITACWSAPRATPSAIEPVNLGEPYRRGLEVVRRSADFRMLLTTYFLQALATGLMLAGAQYVATHVLRNQGAVTGLFVALIAPAIGFAPAWQVMARRSSKRQAFLVASALFAVAALAMVPLAWAPGWWVYLPVGLAGTAYAGMQALPMAMLPDVISADASQHGTDRAGTFGGVWTAAETTGFALGGIVLSALLALGGYRSSTTGAHQTPAVVTTIALAFSLVPGLLVGLSLVWLRRYRLGRPVATPASLGPTAGASTPTDQEQP